MSDRRPTDRDLEANARGRRAPKSAREILQPAEVPPPPLRSRAARHPIVVSLNFIITIAIVALIAVGGVGLYAKVQFDQAGPLGTERVAPITAGAGLSSIAEVLEESGIISNRWVFRVAVAFFGNQGNLQAGEYLIQAEASMREIMDLMVVGDTLVYAVTIPEGLTSEQIVARLLANEVLTGDVAEIPAEGLFLPETYQFSRGDSRQDILDRMIRDHDRAVADIWNRRAEGLPIASPDELVILASIVEKETGIADERSRVAAVFINRLNIGMRLQSDPTIIYGIYGGAGPPPGHIILQSELDRQTAYNTYQIDGLPPGPIASPGVAALEAVANPSQTNDLFFVADGTGGHVFAETLEEHRRNVARYRQIQAQQAEAAADETPPAADGVLPEEGPAPAPAE
jgi:UPF0755 protein